MAAGYEDDWSDSDDDMGSDVETSVQLGIPDGPLKSPSDLLDAAVSRIGGHPVRYIPRHTCTIQIIEYTYFISSIGFLDFTRTAFPFGVV